MSWRLVPAAITPVKFSDIYEAFVQRKGALSNFRDILTNYFNGNNTYTFTSLMRANFACLQAIKLANPDRNEVIIPRYSCPSFVHGILAAGLKVRYCDIEPKTLSIRLSSLQKVISPKTCAIIVTNLFGLSSQIELITKICKARGIIVIEGVDYALGSTYQNKRVGTYGDFVILNFQEGKALPIGGAAVVERKTSIMRSYNDNNRKSRGWKQIFVMFAYTIFSRPFFYFLLNKGLNLLKINRKQLSMEDTIRQTKGEFDFVFKTKDLQAISDFQAALGKKLLAQLPVQTQIRLNNSKAIENTLRKAKSIKFVIKESKMTNVHYIRYPILVKCKCGLLAKRCMDYGIEASRMYIEHGMKVEKSKYPGAYEVACSLLTLPCHPYVSKKDIKLICNIVEEHQCI